MIPFLDLGLQTQELRTELDAALANVLDSGRYIGGEEVDEFERDFAAYCGARFAVGTGNGLDALALMLRAYGIGPGHEVIVPSNTYIATWLAVSMVGAQVVPVEPSIQTYNLDADRVTKAITTRTRAILAVHLYGRMADMESLRVIADRAGVRLLADSAQAHGIKLRADAAAFSFYPSKNLGALGDGGAVVTDDPQIASRVRMLGNYGSREKYLNVMRGVNSRLDPMQAAVLRIKLRHLDTWNCKRLCLAAGYLRALAGIDGLALPQGLPGQWAAVQADENTVWHIFAVRHARRDELARSLAAAGIGTLIHYPQPPHLSEAYRDLGFRHGDFPLAEKIAETELSLPLHPQLTEAQMGEVAGALAEAQMKMTADCDRSNVPVATTTFAV